MTIDRTDPHYQKLCRILGADYANAAFGWPTAPRGRPGAWPDCPAELRDEYRRVARRWGGVKARARLEARA